MGKGRRYWNYSENLKHYTCMADIIGCSGLLGRQRILSRQCPVSPILLSVWPWLVFAEFMGIGDRRVDHKASS